MRRPGPVIHTVIFLVLWPLIIIFAPVIFVAGEPVNRYVMRERIRWSASTAQVAVIAPSGSPARMAAPMQLTPRASLVLAVISNPLWIAITAPGRWVSDQFRRNLHMPENR